MSITASGTTNFTYQTFWTTATTTPNHDIEVDWSTLFSCGYFETENDYKAFVNNLHVEEKRKDVFRESSITSRNKEYSHTITNQFIPATRNLRGKESRRI